MNYWFTLGILCQLTLGNVFEALECCLPSDTEQFPNYRPSATATPDV